MNRIVAYVSVLFFLVVINTSVYAAIPTVSFDENENNYEKISNSNFKKGSIQGTAFGMNCTYVGVDGGDTDYIYQYAKNMKGKPEKTFTLKNNKGGHLNSLITSSDKSDRANIFFTTKNNIIGRIDKSNNSTYYYSIANITGDGIDAITLKEKNSNEWVLFVRDNRNIYTVAIPYENNKQKINTKPKASFYAEIPTNQYLKHEDFARMYWDNAFGTKNGKKGFAHGQSMAFKNDKFYLVYSNNDKNKRLNRNAIAVYTVSNRKLILSKIVTLNKNTKKFELEDIGFAPDGKLYFSINGEGDCTDGIYRINDIAELTD